MVSCIFRSPLLLFRAPSTWGFPHGRIALVFLFFSHIEREVTMTHGFLFAFFTGPFASPITWAVVGIVALLLFGNRLPSVMRSLGRSVVEFKKGVSGIQDEVDDAVRSVDEQVQQAKKEDLEAQA